MPKLIAFHLPQFHPIPENDEWWGKGFTEWTNVTKAKPLFKGHYQPHLPADLGFYDLRLPQARQAQAELAQEYGIYGFMYYHYWFKGKRLLEKPIDDILNSGQPDFPFCLCWANETWSRRWIGEEKEVLLKQEYSPEDDKSHANWLVHAFKDPRYIRIKERPLFTIYRPSDLPNLEGTVETIKSTIIANGLPEPYLIGCNAHDQKRDFRKDGLDAILNFEPQLGVLPYAFDDQPSLSRFRQNLKLGFSNPNLRIYDYKQAISWMHQRKFEYPYYPCVMVGWDNTPRRGKNGIIMVNQSPSVFAESLQWAKSKSKEFEAEIEGGVIFINAWNEWAEGNHLEPCQRNGLTYLDEVKKFVESI